MHMTFYFTEQMDTTSIPAKSGLHEESSQLNIISQIRFWNFLNIEKAFSFDVVPRI